MSSRPHRHNAELIDWKMLPFGVLCLALGGVVSYSAASSFGLEYVGIDHLPSSVAELDSIDKTLLKTKTLVKSVSEPKKPTAEQTPQLVNAPSAKKIVVQQAETTDSALLAGADQPKTADDDRSEATTSVNESTSSTQTEEVKVPDTAEIVARANQAAGIKPVSEQPEAARTQRGSTRINDDEYQRVRASLDPNSLPILRVTAPDSKEPKASASKPDAREELPNSEQRTLSKSITDAVDSGVVSRVLDLIEKGEPLDGVDEAGQSMLLKAAWNGDEKMFDALLAQGASVDIRSRDGRTPLFGATASGSLGLVKKLVEKKEGKTPLMLSARSSYPEIALYLLEQGADPDIVDSKGRNALLYALWDRNIEVIRSLIQYGSNLDQVDNDGHATFDIARLRRIELPGMNLEEPDESAN